MTERRPSVARRRMYQTPSGNPERQRGLRRKLSGSALARRASSAAKVPASWFSYVSPGKAAMSAVQSACKGSTPAATRSVAR